MAPFAIYEMHESFSVNVFNYVDVASLIGIHSLLDIEYSSSERFM